VAKGRSRHAERQVEKGETRRERSEEQSHGIAVEVGGGARPEEGESTRRLGQPRVVQEPPRQDAGRIVEQEVARDQEEEGGDDAGVRGEAAEGGVQPTSRWAGR
jgi:hypothetical protein